MTAINRTAIAATIRTDELQTGDWVEHYRSGERFTVATVTESATDWRFHQPGGVTSEGGMDIVGRDVGGNQIRYTAAQSCLWWVVGLDH